MEHLPAPGPACPRWTPVWPHSEPIGASVIDGAAAEHCPRAPSNETPAPPRSTPWWSGSRAILRLLADGVPRPKAAIIEALAGRHDRQDVVHALIRLAVTGQVNETGGKYTPGAAPEADVG